MNIGFTGTRRGMSPTQRTQLAFVLDALVRRAEISEFHYGMHEAAELRADIEARDLAQDRKLALVGYPACSGEELARNRRLVAEVEVLIAAPETDTEVQRSGTWATVRYARQRGIPVVMLSRGKKGKLL